MISRFATMGLALCAGALASLSSAVDADNINTSGVLCQNFNAAQALDIDYVVNGVRNINAAARPVICSLPRAPLASGLPATFFVDGQNFNNTTTTCTLFVYTFGGAVTVSSTFTEPAVPGASVTWDHNVTFPAGSVATFDYVNVLCTIPGAVNGTVFGVTSVQ
jgi:hypothetical protein